MRNNVQHSQDGDWRDIDKDPPEIQGKNGQSKKFLPTVNSKQVMEFISLSRKQMKPDESQDITDT